MPQLSSQAFDNLQVVQRLINAGQTDRAEFELQAWCDHAPVDAEHLEPAPPAARALLAALLARRGELLRARVVIGEPQRRDGHEMDADEGQLAASLLIAAGLENEGRRLAAWLHHLHGHDAAVARWITLLDLPGLNALPQAESSHQTRLADELRSQPELVPSLVYAQKQSPDTRTLSLLRGALKQIVHRFENTSHHVPLLQALSETAELVGDDDDARHWAHRGLTADPYNASLALLLGRIPDDVAVGPAATQVLKRVSLKFPHYPDVQRAFEQRRIHDQMREAA